MLYAHILHSSFFLKRKRYHMHKKINETDTAHKENKAITMPLFIARHVNDSP